MVFGVEGRGMTEKRIARLLVGDHSTRFCVRSIDVIVPGCWNGGNVLDYAAALLPAKMTIGHDDPGLIQFYPMDDDEVFADWSDPGAKLGQLEFFAYG